MVQRSLPGSRRGGASWPMAPTVVWERPSACCPPPRRRAEMQARRPGVQRKDSSVRARLPIDIRTYLVRTNPGRWTIPAVAAALGLPEATRTSLEGWALLIDQIDAAIERLR